VRICGGRRVKFPPATRQIRWPSVGSFDGRLRGDSHGRRQGVGTYRKKGARWMAAEGGVRPRRGRDLQGRYLSFSEREEIALARAAGEGVRSIARRLGRSPSTVSRELSRNAQRDGCYRATVAHARAWQDQIHDRGVRG